jgi:hypothetical protein
MQTRVRELRCETLASKFLMRPSALGNAPLAQTLKILPEIF